MKMNEFLNGVKAMAAENTKDAASTTENQTGKKSKKPLIIAAAAVVVLVLLIALLAGGRKTLDMKDYVQVNFYGLNEKGRGELVVDYSAMVQDLPEKKGEVSQKDAISAVFGDLADSIGNRALIESAVRCELDKSSGLSNGDKVTVNIQVNDDRCKELGIKIKEKPLAFSVEGLKEVETFDAFADITVMFDGVSPNATARVLNNSKDETCMYYYYSLDKNSGLAVGDTVTVSISEDNIDAVAEETGKVPAEMEKQFTVEGVSSHASELSQISDAALTDMQKEATDTLTAHVARNWDDSESLESMDYLGSYLLTRKPNSSARYQNLLYMVHEVSYGNNYDGADMHMKYYYYTVFTNVVVHSDGSISWDGYDTADNYYRFDVNGHTFYVYGYETLAELFKDCVTTRIDNYTYDSSVAQ